MNDGSCINLGKGAMLKAIEQLNERSTEQMMKFLPFEFHDASTWEQLEWNHWVAVCKNKNLSRHESGGKVKVIRLKEEEKEHNVATPDFKNKFIELILTFCLFDKPPDERPKGTERRKYECWKAANQKSMEENSDLRKLYWSDVDMVAVTFYESDYEAVRPNRRG